MKQKSPSKSGWSSSIGTLKFSILLAAFCMPVYGQQELPEQIAPSPTSVQFQKYGDYPVSHYTGIPDIKIPIYTIQEGDITVPIYLSFHASGLVVNDPPGLVGTGWTLNTGGMISRIVNGIPDDYGYMYPLLVPDFSLDYATRYDEVRDTYNNQLNDHELDLYSYNILGRSGKYMPWANYLMDSLSYYAGEPFMLTRDNVNVSTSGMTDENGISYIVGGAGREEYQSFNIPRWSGLTSAVSTWHLASIISSKHPGMGVSYQYQPGPVYGTRTTWEYKLDDQYGLEGRTDPEDISIYYPHTYLFGTNREQTSGYYRQYNTCVPQRITFSSGYLLFHLNTSTKHLEKIEIFNRDSQLLRTIKFVSENFLQNYYRKLQAVVFEDAAGLEQERYSFNYYNENNGATQGKDHWGFYNGSTFLGDYIIGIPNFTYQYFSSGSIFGGNVTLGSGADRTPNASAAQTFMLEKITYPSGGHTIFQYEGNSDGISRPLGGLRIKNISSYTATGQLASQKTYSYQPGLPELSVDYDLYRETATTVFTHNYYEGRRTKIYEDAPVPLSPKGAPIGYQQVTETEGDVVTTYKYDDNPAYTYERMSYPYFSVPGESTPLFKLLANNYKPWNFGYLISKDIVSPGYERSELYSYQDSICKTVHDLAIYQHVFPLWYLGVGSWPSQRAYENAFYGHYTTSSLYNFANRYHYSALKRQTSKTVKETWADGRGFAVTEDYEYGDSAYPLQRTAMKVTNSRAELERTEYKYPYNYLSNPVYEQLAIKNRISVPVEETKKNVTLNKELLKINRDYAFYNSTAQLSAIRKSVGGASPDTEFAVDRYDNNGHILQQTDKGGLVTSFIFGYGQLYPVAKIVGADYNTSIALINQTLLDNSSTTEADMRNHLAALRTGLPSAQVTTYTYDTGIGMSSETDARGKTIYYKYDQYQRLETIKDADGNIVKNYNYHLKP